ncbi:MAG: circularly permuted type 2 ATP-grasp protein [Myxococcota bacterium]
MVWDDYVVGGFYDEMFVRPGAPRPGCELLAERLAALPVEELDRRQQAAEVAMLNLGVTFNVYGDDRGTEKIFPFDLVPRVIGPKAWEALERGLAQRIEALNLFVDDLYNDQHILNDGTVPRDIIETCSGFLKACMGLKPPQDVWIHVTGTDLVRDTDGTFYVLEDNLRCPSGVSYVLENRAIMKRTFPSVFERAGVRPVDGYPSDLLTTLQAMSPNPTANVAVLTPGIYNSAYFEHSLLAREMGIELVEGRDLVVDDGYVKAKTTRGLQRVDVLYRRIDDTFLDPDVFRADSVLGVPGLMDVFRRGRVALANAPGTGVADDKGVYAYTPDIVRYYLKQEPLLPIVPTYLCRRKDDVAYVLDNLEKLVVKATNESGGYGMLIGPASTEAQRAEFADKLRARPEGYIAQPTLQLSTVPTLIDGRLEGRHVDLRPYILYGDRIRVTPGGLTRVALKKGSLVVNSSQGGGSKDTWVLNGVAQGGGVC